MNTTQATNLLTVDEVAKELQTEPLNVMRIICKGKLAATQLGASGKYVVVPSNLAAYVQAGAPDFTPPPFSGNWFDSKDTRPAGAVSGGAFRDAVLKAAESLWPDAATVQEWYTSQPRPTYTLSVPGEDLRKISLQPSPRPTMPGEPPRRYPQFGQMFLAEAWHDSVSALVGTGRLKQLYDPATYRTNLAAAWTATISKIISASKMFNPKQANGREGESVRVSMEVRLELIARWVSKEELEQLAF